MKRTFFLYLPIVALTILPTIALLHLGSELPPPAATPMVPKAAQAAPAKASPVNMMVEGLTQNLDHPLCHLFLKLLVIVALATTALTDPPLTLFGEKSTSPNTAPAPSHT